MAIAKNYALQKNHFRKHWQERVRTHFDQAGKKVSRRTARAKKAALVAPRPLELLRPIVRAPTIKYNRKVRAGRGFSLEELKAAGIAKKQALSIGVAVDPRRQNRSVEGFEANVARLQDYKSKLILFPRKASAEEVAAATQASTAAVFPIVQAAPESAPRAITEEGKAFKAYRALREARSDARYKGIREKRAKDRAEAEAEKKK
ncbi:hypothetical protein D0Z00_001486 [Geotrichum galactomycetum]|uniref:Uncharacterized protein n=1 Tax=Geotrichum galactomycetum TaxID=27317 RepID=A0ACB6V6T2_9ASCO|nr:hypothetical protein D0Z00_001486 [Geotrichum candidum]